MNIPTLKRQMRDYAVKRGLKLPRVIYSSPVWGKGAQGLAWRVSGDLNTHGRKVAQGTAAAPLWLYFNPPTPAEHLRERLVHAYDSLNGVTYGSVKQKEISKFAGLPWTLPWCAMTFWYAAKHMAGYNGPGAANIAYVPSWELFAQNRKLIVPFRKAKPGMAVTFVWDGKRQIGTGDHIGIIDQKSTFSISAVVATDEGNAGGAVGQHSRYWWQINTIFDIAKLQK